MAAPAAPAMPETRQARHDDLQSIEPINSSPLPSGAADDLNLRRVDRKTACTIRYEARRFK
ncbi:hypothetical protein BM1_10679 [Bipolaris maydis]|nr:hypothetical protein BM1_10679 [Bipolaris maydis]